MKMLSNVSFISMAIKKVFLPILIQVTISKVPNKYTQAKIQLTKMLVTGQRFFFFWAGLEVFFHSDKI